MSRKNTLFSYFTPKSNENLRKSNEQGDKLHIATPESNGKRKSESPVSTGIKNKRPTPSSKNRSAGKSAESRKSLTASTAQTSGGIDPVICDLVWARLDGYPWWPGLVCQHPTSGSHSKVAGKRSFVNVQFFDKQPTRSWIDLRSIKPFTGTDCSECRTGGIFHSTDPNVTAAARDASKAFSLSVNDRASLLVDLPATDAESSDEDPSSRQMSDVDEEDGKENKDGENDGTKMTKRRLKMSPSVDKKRKRVVVADDLSSSEDEYKPDNEGESSDESEASSVSEAEDGAEDDAEADSADEAKQPIKKARKTVAADSSFTSPSANGSSQPSSRHSSLRSPFGSIGTKTVAKLATYAADKDASFSADGSGDVIRAHAAFEFLKPESVRDSSKRKPSDPDYDPRTLYVPDSFKSSCTPAMRQWWEIKESHYDTVLFFKMGKFYELFHMDADVAVKELALVYMKGNYAHAGFPEISYGRYADIMLQKGYKVARIEQTETPEMMNDRCAGMNKKTKYDKVVRREVCQVTTPGTRTYGFLDGEAVEANCKYLLAIAEKDCGSSSEGCTFGVCFVDTSVGQFHVGQFQDDRHNSRLRTLVACHPPAQVLCEKGKTSPALQQLIKSTLHSAVKEALTPRTEFWDATMTLKVLAEEDYFRGGETNDVCWPEALKVMISPDDPLCRTPADEYNLAIRALGAVVWYLRYCLMDQEVLSMKNFVQYTPVDCQESTTREKEAILPSALSRHMVLDAVTLANLDVLENQTTKTTEGTLLAKMDNCCTPFGRRLFRQFLCAPLCDPVAIGDRLDAVQELMLHSDVVSSASDVLRKLPDLERLLSRIHALGHGPRSRTHPDSRAVMFEDGVYSKRKIESFLAALNGFKQLVRVMELFSAVNSGNGPSSKVLHKCTASKKDGGYVPLLEEHLSYFDQAFNHEEAKKAGAIIPTKGYVQEYDDAISEIASIETELDAILEKQKKIFGCKVTFYGTGKNRYQLEVPEAAARKVPQHYEVTSQRKGFKRYSTAEVRDLVASLFEAEDKRDIALKDTMRTIFGNFDKHYNAWNSAVQCAAMLDALVSLAVYCTTSDLALCRPEVLAPSAAVKPFIEIREGRHPCTMRLFGGGDFIPNDIVVGIKDEMTGRLQADAELVLVTGPNMGGKSTLMRQAGLIVIMAQMGCLVPAEKCVLTAVDRIFTRLGASDRIMSGESTFFVELSETSAILRHATRHSLVLLDELGRGTATYDGTAIASAVVRELSENVQCRTLFSTHYHSLVEDFSCNPHVQLGHMACMVENDNDNGDPSSETITFLYKFVDAACPKSYGFNAARLAGIPEEVIQMGLKKARDFEQVIESKKLIRALTAANDDANCLQVLQKMRSLARA